MLKKQCSQCGLDQNYKSKITYNNALKTNSLCKKCSNLNKNLRQGDCSILLQDTLLTYYWIGFILADAHIHKNKRLKVALASKDIEHLLKLKAYLKIKTHRNYHNYSEFSIMDSISIEKLCIKFDIKQNKTEKACNISGIKNNLLKSLFIGFIDGDGSISKQYKRNDACLKIKCHSAWLDNLNIFSQIFLGKTQAYLNKEGYANLNIGNHLILQNLKQFSINNKLPILERKWKNIEL